MVDGTVSVSPDPSFSPSESDPRSCGTSYDKGAVVGKIKERARSEGVIPNEEAPVSVDFILEGALFRVFILSSVRAGPRAVCSNIWWSRWKLNITWFNII